MSIEIAFVEEMTFVLNDISVKNKFAPGTDSFFPRSVTISAYFNLKSMTANAKFGRICSVSLIGDLI